MLHWAEMGYHIYDQDLDHIKTFNWFVQQIDWQVSLWSENWS